MIVGDDSPLRRLPAQLNRKQTLYFDGIRYSVEMADLAHTRLRNTLLVLATDRSTPPPHLRFVTAVQDAWSMVDSIHRLRELLKRTPGLKQHAPGLHLFLQHTAAIEELRHSVQHLDSQINELINQNVPVWGVLSWFVMQGDFDDKAGLSCSIIAGTLFESKGSPLVLPPAGKAINLPVDLITLTASGYSLCLSDVMRHTESLIKELEQQLNDQFKDLPQAGTDLLVVVMVKPDDANNGNLASSA